MLGARQPRPQRLHARAPRGHGEGDRAVEYMRVKWGVEVQPVDPVQRGLDLLDIKHIGHHDLSAHPRDAPWPWWPRLSPIVGRQPPRRSCRWRRLPAHECLPSEFPFPLRMNAANQLKLPLVTFAVCNPM